MNTNLELMTSVTVGVFFGGFFFSLNSSDSIAVCIQRGVVCQAQVYFSNDLSTSATIVWEKGKFVLFNDASRAH